MISGKDKKLLYVAILMGFLALILNFAYVKHVQTEASGGARKYIVARHDIASGEEINDNDLVEVSVRDDYSGYLRSTYLSLSEFSTIKGKTAQWDIAKGEFILKEALGVGTLDIVKEDLPLNERLYSIRVGEEASQGYRLARGDRIDIYQVISDKEPTLVLTDVPIAGVGAQMQRSRSGELSSYSIITLRLTQGQLEHLLRFVSQGDFEMALRGTKG